MQPRSSIFIDCFPRPPPVPCKEAIKHAHSCRTCVACRPVPLVLLVLVMADRIVLFQCVSCRLQSCVRVMRSSLAVDSLQAPVVSAGCVCSPIPVRCSMLADCCSDVESPTHLWDLIAFMCETTSTSLFTFACTCSCSLAQRCSANTIASLTSRRLHAI